MNSRKKIVITGASGFLGSHLVERLKDDERYKVYALSSKPDDLKEKISGENIEYIHKDSLDAEMLKDSTVINCAYPRNSIGTAIADGLKYIQKVFESAVGSGAAAIINISSQSVYSQQRIEAATEETPVCLESPYAVGKYAVEILLESICKGSDTKYTSLRMASLIGPGFDQRIVNRFVKQAIETGKLTVKRNRQKFGFFDVEDAVSGIAAMLAADAETWKPVYNLGRKGSYTLIQIAETVRDVLQMTNTAEVNIDIVDGEETGNSELSIKSFINDISALEMTGLSESVKRIASSFSI